MRKFCLVLSLVCILSLYPLLVQIYFEILILFFNFKFYFLIYKQGLTYAHIPSRMERTGLMRSDGKRPDGATLAPWKSGCLLVWNATCADTLGASYRVYATSMSGKVAAAVEEKKIKSIRTFLLATCSYPSRLRNWEQLAQDC